MNDGAVAQSIVLPHRSSKSLLTGWIASSSRNEAARALLSLGDFLRALRHRWLLFALIALAVKVLVTAISFALPSRYTGEAVLPRALSSPHAGPQSFKRLRFQLMHAGNADAQHGGNLTQVQFLDEI